MRKTAIGAAVLAAGFLAAGVAQAQQDSPWLHIRVTDNDEGSKVSVNLPLSLVEIALEIAEAEIQRQSHVHFHDSDVTVEDLRRMWNELRDAGDADFVTVEEGDERIQISRQADKVLIQMTELEAALELQQLAGRLEGGRRPIERQIRVLFL